MPLFDNALLRTIAIFLVTNSHLDHLYPLPQLGTGGSLGNAIFFMMSGYGLALSNREHGRSFPEWYWRRFARIYPSLFLVVLCLGYLPERGWQLWSFQDYLKQWKPDAVAIEDTFYSKNVKSLVVMARVSGVIIAAARNMNYPLFLYTPTRVKKTVTGTGQGTKDQVAYMVKRLLALTGDAPQDALDALAVAITHVHSEGL